MHPIVKRLQQEFEAYPLQTIGVVAMALTAGAKLMNAVGDRKARRIWEREVKRRERLSRTH